MVGTTRTVVAKAAALVCAGVIALGASGCSLTVPPLSEAEAPQTYAQTIDDSLLVAPGTLTVAVDTADAPQAMAQNGGIEGYDVDLARLLAARMGLDLNVIEGTSAESTVGEGLADVYLGAETSDGSSSITVSGVYLENATAVFGRTEGAGTGLTSDVLAQAVVGVQESSASQEVLVRAGIASTQQTFSNVNACFEALGQGQVDYVVCDATAGAYLARAYPGVTFLGTLSTTTTFGLATSADASDLTDALTQALGDITSDGSIDAVHTAWYGHLPVSLADTAVSGVTVADTGTDDDSDADAATTSDAPSDPDSMNSLD